jgi:MFS superfamily sulfate permease-like transporter
VIPSADQWWTGLTRGAIPQLPLTLLNSVIAVCALSGDYFPGRGVTPRRMAASVGLMNLLCVPFGGMPMCHGAGGLAAQYRFGARTGGSVVMLGAMKILAGLLLGGMLLTTLQHYPTSILAVLVIVAGLTLARAAKDCLHGRTLLIVAVMTGLIVTINTLTGFIVGCAIAAVLAGLDRKRSTTG